MYDRCFDSSCVVFMSFLMFPSVDNSVFFMLIILSDTLELQRSWIASSPYVCIHSCYVKNNFNICISILLGAQCWCIKSLIPGPTIMTLNNPTFYYSILHLGFLGSLWFLSYQPYVISLMIYKMVWFILDASTCCNAIYLFISCISNMIT